MRAEQNVQISIFAIKWNIFYFFLFWFELKSIRVDQNVINSECDNRKKKMNSKPDTGTEFKNSKKKKKLISLVIYGNISANQ